jgi:hypothetical protein
MADRIGQEYAKAQAKTIFRNLLDVSATVQIGDEEGPSATTSRSVLCHHLPISPVYPGLKNRIRSRRSP